VEAAAISAVAAWAAAGVAATGAIFQFFVGRKQATAALISANAALRNSEKSGQHKKAECPPVFSRELTRMWSIASSSLHR
jgi:hypothetical protein